MAGRTEIFSEHSAASRRSTRTTMSSRATSLRSPLPKSSGTCCRRVRCALGVLCIVVVCSCRSAPADRANDASPNPPPSVESLDENAVKAMTHALLDAYDRADEAPFAGSIGARFVQLDEQRIRDRDAVLGNLRARRGRGAPVVSRTYRE